MEPPVNLDADLSSPEQSLDFRTRWQISPDAPLLVIVSRLEKSMKAEGIANVMHAVAHLNAPELRLAVVGDGDAAATLRCLAEEVNARVGAKVIMMTGLMNDPRPAYSAADLVLAMGGAAIRGLSFGKPLIVLGSDGFSKPFTQNNLPYFMRYGFYGNGSDGDPIEKLSFHIHEMLNPTIRDELSHFGRRVVTERFALETATQNLLCMYQRALAGSTLSRRCADVAFVLGRDAAHHVLALCPTRVSSAIRSSYHQGLRRALTVGRRLTRANPTGASEV
nr:glycosyltransferase [Microvirga massiliensis]